MRREGLVIRESTDSSPEFPTTIYRYAYHDITGLSDQRQDSDAREQIPEPRKSLGCCTETEYNGGCRGSRHRRPRPQQQFPGVQSVVEMVGFHL
jgi:hypothetical protein